MRSLLFFLVAILLSSSCEERRFETYEIRVLDRFQTNEENIQLGLDLVNLNFNYFLLEKYPDLDANFLQLISWEYFSDKETGEISFRLTLVDDAIHFSKKLRILFERVVDDQIMALDYRRSNFSVVVSLANEFLSYLDGNDIDGVWGLSSDGLKKFSDKNNIKKVMENRQEIKALGNDRKFFSKQYYDILPGEEKANY
jgi:hypothetical protein